MKSPTEADFKDFKRLGRYLIGKPRVVNMFEAQRESKVTQVFCDSDNAGCLLTRRSTTGLVTTVGRTYNQDSVELTINDRVIEWRV